MYNTNDDKLPSRPAVLSQTQAGREFAEWVAKNERRHIEDSDGLTWNIKIDVNEFPSERDLHQGVWKVCMRLGVDTTARQLVETGTLDESKDARTIKLLGTETLPLRMRPIHFQADTLEDLRLKLAGHIEGLRRGFQTHSLTETKRGLVFRWIDQSCRFGGQMFSKQDH